MSMSCAHKLIGGLLCGSIDVNCCECVGDYIINWWELLGFMLFVHVRSVWLSCHWEGFIVLGLLQSSLKYRRRHRDVSRSLPPVNNWIINSLQLYFLRVLIIGREDKIIHYFIIEQWMTSWFVKWVVRLWGNEQCCEGFDKTKNCRFLFRAIVLQSDFLHMSFSGRYLHGRSIDGQIATRFPWLGVSLIGIYGWSRWCCCRVRVAK